jgi:hypothetical protein
MKNLAKTHKDYILQMIKNNSGMNNIKAYCLGAGFDVTNYSSPIHIGEFGKLTMRYKTENTYYYI